MRPLEKRIAAVEARTIATDGAGNMRVFWQPAGADPQAFAKRCRIEAAGADYHIVAFVAPGSAMATR